MKMRYLFRVGNIDWYTAALIACLLALFVLSSCSPSRTYYKVQEVKAVKDKPKNRPYLQSYGLGGEAVGGFWVNGPGGWEHYTKTDFRKIYKRRKPR